MSKITPSIYKIDLEKLRAYIKLHKLRSDTDEEVTNHGTTATTAHKRIAEVHAYKRKQNLSNAQAFTLLQNGLQTTNDRQVAIYGTKSSQRPHEWQGLFQREIGNLKVQRQNLAAFITVGDACYAISAGSGYTLFEQFIDTSFPLDIARRIMSPELDATSERAITGALYGRMQQFRTAQLIASSQNLGTIWQIIKGKVNDDTLNSNSFQDLFEASKSRINIEAGSSLKIRSSMAIDKLLAFISWLVVVMETEPSEQQVESFRFLDTLREVSPRKNGPLVDKLYEQLCADILVALTTNTAINSDFSHKYFSRFQSAERYEFDKSSLNVDGFPREVPPSAEDVLTHLYHGDFLTATNAVELRDELEKITFCAVHNDETETTRASMLSHLHGEVSYNGKSYFLVDGKWYIAEDDFITRVAQDFEGLLASEFFDKPANLLLGTYNLDRTEAVYNESYIESSEWITADRAFINNVELADLIGWKDGIIYIVHNKVGFNVTVRDVCSQILHSMSILDQARATSDADAIGEYWDKIKLKHYKVKVLPIKRKDFIDLILKTDSSKIVYVLGYAATGPVDGSCQSNIAKFESVKLCQSDRRAFDFGLKIVHLEPTS